MRTAIVYDRINKWGGAERVLLALHEIFPEASLYTSVYSPKKALWAKVFPKVYLSWLNKIPFLQDRHELLSVFMPLAFESFDFSEYDLVISVTSESAKGILTKPHTKHICYCLTPTRYLWSGFEEYQSNPHKLLSWIPFYRIVSRPFIWHMRNWDKIAAQRPDTMIAISTEVKYRIKKYYGRESKIIYPPVDTNKFKIQNSKVKTTIQNSEHSGISKKSNQPQTSAYYLIVSRLEPYKKVDLAIDTFNKLGYPLVVIGTGSSENKLKAHSSKNIEFMGFVKDEELPSYYQNAKAFIFPQEEDFGITAVEAQAAGCPVIALRKGGILDTVIENKTGIFFDKQESGSLFAAVKRFEKMKFDKENLFKNAEKFSEARFKKEIMDLISKKV